MTGTEVEMKRVRRFRVGPFVAGIALLLAGHSAGGASPTAAAVAMPTAQEAGTGRVLTFGHSYVAGLGASKASKAWPSIVAARTCRPLVNKARSGDLSAETENQLLMAASTLLPSDVVVIETGINDVRLFGPDADLLHRYGQHLTEMVSFVRAMETGSRVPVVLVADPGIADAAWAKYPPYDKGSQETADAYAQKLESIAAEFTNVTVVDVRSEWSEAHIAVDGVHPNDAGHALVASAVEDVLRADGLGRCQQVETIEIDGPDLVDAPYASVSFTASFTPERSLHQVVWSVTEPDGTPTDKATIDEDGILTVNHRDGDVLVTATAADGAGAQASVLVQIALDTALLRGNAARWPGSSVTASSAYNSSYGPENVRDGVIGQPDNGDWASAGEQNPWIQLEWETPIEADRIVIYDRAGIDDVRGGTLSFSDGSTVEVTDVPPAGGAKTVTFGTKTFTSVRFQVEGGTGPNTGLSELEVYALPSPPDMPTAVSARAGKERATVSWDPPAFDGGAPITGYVVTPYEDGTPLDAVNVGVDTTEVVVPGLTSGQAYTFTVAATSLAGRGRESSPTDPVIPT